MREASLPRPLSPIKTKNCFSGTSVKTNPAGKGKIQRLERIMPMRKLSLSARPKRALRICLALSGLRRIGLPQVQGFPRSTRRCHDFGRSPPKKNSLACRRRYIYIFIHLFAHILRRCIWSSYVWVVSHVSISGSDLEGYNSGDHVIVLIVLCCVVLCASL